MKKILVLAGFFAVSAISYFAYNFYSQKPEQPLKPANVPDEAVWINGCNGTNWFELVRMNGDTARFRIYHSDGGLLIDANFIADSVFASHITETDWNEHIDFYDGVEIYTNVLNKAGNYHTLKPHYPAYFDGQE